MFSITFSPGNPGKPSSPCRGKCIHTLSIIGIIIVPLNERVTAFVSLIIVSLNGPGAMTFFIVLFSIEVGMYYMCV